MLQDFYGNFREMHEAVRTRMQSDVITMESAAVALRAKGETIEEVTGLADAMLEDIAAEFLRAKADAEAAKPAEATAKTSK